MYIVSITWNWRELHSCFEFLIRRILFMYFTCVCACVRLEHKKSSKTFQSSKSLIAMSIDWKLLFLEIFVLADLDCAVELIQRIYWWSLSDGSRAIICNYFLAYFQIRLYSNSITQSSNVAHNKGISFTFINCST